jgi:phenylacetic acid degradation operon negative regulatory protein
MGIKGAADGLLLKSSSEGDAIDRRLVAAGWDLGELTRRYRKFVNTFSPVVEAIAAIGVPADTLPAEAAFVIRTLLIHQYRKIHLRDPLLPPMLLPGDWVGAAAYELTRSLYSKVFPAAERYLSNTASTTAGALPAADASTHARFGGLTSS